jgi:hypothetical protein
MYLRGETDMKLQVGLAAVAALVAAICFAGAPAEARDCPEGRCANVAKTKKLTKTAGHVSRKATPRRARRAPARPTYVKWHGWTGTASTFHLDGVSYHGGSRRGPAAAYNNWEGGFQPEAFWALHLRNVG